jgi:geranylgeranyl pyrophosphate synthase
MASAMRDASQFSNSSIAAQQSMLRERLHRLLTVVHPVLCSDIEQALEGAGKHLSRSEAETGPMILSRTAGVWPLLTLHIAQYISPDIDLEFASSVAIAIECFVCALDLLDDVEDEDQTPIVQAIGIPRVLNVSTALLTLAQHAILSLSKQDVAPAFILRLLKTIQEASLNAIAGQHRDLLAERRSAQDLTREECMEIAAGKAGSIMRLACRLGALCAGADDTLCEQFSEVGELLGVAHQLDNDSHDLYYLLQDESSAILSEEGVNTRKSGKTDLVRGKKTLPVVLAAKTSTPLQKTGVNADEENRQYLQALQEGIITTWGICLLYHERARERLQRIEAQKPIPPALYFFLGL